MKNLRRYFPKYTTSLIIILFVTTLLTLFWTKFYEIVLLRPADLYSPKNWYRFFTYPFYINGLKVWLFTSIAILICGGIIEKRLSPKYILSLILFSSLFGGLIYAIINRDEIDGAMGSAHMISWGYWSAAIVIGLKFRRELNIAEKIILLIGFIEVFLISRDNYGFYIASLSVIGSVVILTLIMRKYWLQQRV